MRNANSQPEPTDVTDALKAWQVPHASASLDQRVLASYRQQLSRVPFWRRFFLASIPVPLPIVVFQAMLLLVATGAVIAFFQERDNRAFPLVQNQRPAEIIPVPVRQDTPAARAIYGGKRPFRLHLAKPRATVISLPVSTTINPVVATMSALLPSPVPPESLAAGLIVAPESPLLTTAAPEQSLRFTPVLNFKAALSDPLKFELLYAAQATAQNEFTFDTALEKTSFFDGRISRTITRAGNWVTKPLEKGVGLYRALPRTIPTLNSFIAPAKDACRAPFRSNAPGNVQIN